MIAAIYARKSTEQNGVADEQKSVARQIDHARVYAQSKGWIVVDEHIYLDDGISGAEFAGRPGFVRLMNAVKPKPSFQVLVMSEESRLGREAIETAYALKTLITAGVRVWFYLEDRERTLDSPTDKLLLSVTAFADELEREKARQRTYDAMQRKAKAGHVTGGRVFGYDNREVVGPDGQRQRVERVINDAEADVVRRIFTLCADGVGKSRIAKMLNETGAPSPRSQQARPRGWAPSSVHEVLYRDLYSGVIVWNRTTKRNKWGQVAPTTKPATEWLRVSAPELRIVSAELWTAVRERLAAARTRYLRATNGRLYGRPRDVDSKYLLPGFARCARCNSGLIVRSRSHGRQRAYFYACGAYHRRGNCVCQSGREVRMEDLNALLLNKIAAVFAPDVIGAAVDRALASLQSGQVDAALVRAEAELPTVEAEIERLTAAIIEGGALAPLVEALKTRQSRAETLRATIANLTIPTPSPADWTAVRASLLARAHEWRGLMCGHVAHARQILRKVLVGPVRCALDDDGLEGSVDLRPLISGLKGLPTYVASPPALALGVTVRVPLPVAA